VGASATGSCSGRYRTLRSFSWARCFRPLEVALNDTWKPADIQNSPGIVLPGAVFRFAELPRIHSLAEQKAQKSTSARRGHHSRAGNTGHTGDGGTDESPATHVKGFL
jgi:hypothetical protein